MGATNFPMTRGQLDPLAAYDQLIAQEQARQAQPRQPMYTPEEIAQRVADNQRMEQLGYLGLLSGDRSAGAVGGMVLKKALGDRENRVSERGVADPLRGTFTYDPEYLRERGDDRMSTLMRGRADLMQRQAEQAQHSADRRLGYSMAGGRGLGGGNVQATFEGNDPVTGARVVVGKDGQTYAIGKDGKQTPFAGPVVPKAAWEKEVSGASDAYVAIKSAGDLLKTVQQNPGGFGWSGNLYQRTPNWAKGATAWALNLSPEERAAQTVVMQKAAAEINRLYGAALSTGEQARASTFLPNPDDDVDTLLNKLNSMYQMASTAFDRYGPAVAEHARARLPSGTWDNDGGDGGGQAPAKPGGKPAGGGMTPAQRAELEELKKWKAGQGGAKPEGSY